MLCKKTIYIISGPCGVGKSTATKRLVHILDNTVLIEGDTINAMFAGKGQLSWKNKKRCEINWLNILTLTQNFIRNDLDVIIDYVVEEELPWFRENISDLNVQIKYVVLRADEEKLIERISKRGDIEYIDRSLFLLQKLENTTSNKQHLLDTTNLKPEEVIKEILESTRFNLN